MFFSVVSVGFTIVRVWNVFLLTLCVSWHKRYLVSILQLKRLHISLVFCLKHSLRRNVVHQAPLKCIRNVHSNSFVFVFFFLYLLYLNIQQDVTLEIDKTFYISFEEIRCHCDTTCGNIQQECSFSLLILLETMRGFSACTLATRENQHRKWLNLRKFPK